MMYFKFECDEGCGAIAETKPKDVGWMEETKHPEGWGIMNITTNPGWSHRYAHVYHFCPECREKLGLAPHQHIAINDTAQIVNAIFKSLVPSRAKGNEK